MSNIIPTWSIGGKIYTSLAEAKAAEVDINAIAQLRHLLKDAINSVNTRTGNIDNVLTEILSEHEAVRAILLSYSKKKPRKKAA